MSTAGDQSPRDASRLRSAASRLASAASAALGALDAADDGVRAALAQGRAEAHVRLREEERADPVSRAIADMVAEFAPGPAGARWTEPMQPALDPLAVASYVRLGGVARQSGDELPVLVPLLNHGNLVLRAETDDDVARDLLHSLALRALLGTAPGQLVLHGFDPRIQGLLTPFAGLRERRDDIVEQAATSPENLDPLLTRLTDQVRWVRDRQQGRRRTLGELRAEAGQPIGMYHLVVILNFPEKISSAALDALITLMRAGPACGISFLVSHTTGVPAAPDVDAVLIGELTGTAVVSMSATGATWPAVADVPFTVDDLPGERRFGALVAAVADAAGDVATPSVGVAKLLAAAGGAAGQSSAQFLKVPIGFDGVDPVTLTLGDDRDPRAHLLVTGATGKGKSNFLKVFVHAIAARYDAEEVSLYLLDLKSGLSFYPLAPGPDRAEWLPQAAVIGLASDREFAVAVLTFLSQEFERRAAAMKRHGVDSISAYRARVPGPGMPRILAVIDEFDVLFQEQDQVAERAVRLLETLARRGRSYGIHLVLASQAISGIQDLLKGQDGIYANFDIRIAFSNTAHESEAVLGPDNRAAYLLRRRGEAIVNLDRGAKDSNRHVVVAEAAEADLARIRVSAWGRRRPNSVPPEVFDGQEPVTLSAATPWLRKLRVAATKRTGAPRIAIVGMPVALPLRMDGIALTAEAGRHLGIFGAGQAWHGADDGDPAVANQALGVMQAVAFSLALQHPDQDATFTMLNFLSTSEFERSGMPELVALMAGLGFPLRVVASADAGRELHAVAEEIQRSSSAEVSRYLLAPAIDRPILDRLDDTSGRPLDSLQVILRDGPARRTHLIAWWTTVGSFVAQKGYSPATEVNARLALRVDTSDVNTLMDSRVSWYPRDNRGLLQDRQQSPAPVTIVPVSPLSYDTARELRRIDWDEP